MNEVIGTVNQLIARGFALNGKVLTQGQISNLVTAGLATKVGTAPKPAGQRGKPAAILSFPATATLNFAAAVATVDDSAPSIQASSDTSEGDGAESSEEVATA